MRLRKKRADTAQERVDIEGDRADLAEWQRDTARKAKEIAEWQSNNVVVQLSIKLL